MRRAEERLSGRNIFEKREEFDLVTCTGDALNHIIDLNNVEKIFQNVYGYLSDGGYFIFDILNEKEVLLGEPIDLDFSDGQGTVYDNSEPGRYY